MRLVKGCIIALQSEHLYYLLSTLLDFMVNFRYRREKPDFNLQFQLDHKIFRLLLAEDYDEG